MSAPCVSVIIPVWNGERYIHEALRSVLSQTFQDYEIICVDDGSIDSSVIELQKYGKRLRIFQQLRSGQGVARNTGATHARGEFIAFLDQDDCWYPNKLASQVEVLRNQADVVLVHCNSDRMNSKGEITNRSVTLTEMPFAIQSPIGQLIGHGLILASTMMVRRETFDRVGGFDAELRGFEDFDLTARLVQKGRFLFLEEPAACYRVHQGGFSQVGGLSVVQSRHRFFLKMRAYYAGDDSKMKIIRGMLAECYSDMGMHAWKAGDRKKARQQFIDSLRENPFKFRTYSRLVRMIILGNAFMLDCVRRSFLCP